MAKITKAECQYGPGMRSAHCSLCRNFRPPASCIVVEGKIAPDAWCNRFARK